MVLTSGALSIWPASQLIWPSLAPEQVMLRDGTYQEAPLACTATESTETSAAKMVAFMILA